MLEKAIAIAMQAHAGQTDKAGMPYILHPLRVMMKMTSVTEMIVAVLHDVVEDSEWTIDQLRAEGFAEEVLAALDLLTKRTGEAYEAFIQRAKALPLSCAVKLADLEDNMDAKRLRNVTEEDRERLEKYRRAWKELNGS
jgi:(p)ppGpp synthase/HD superfamily hydrolase